LLNDGLPASTTRNTTHHPTSPHAIFCNLFVDFTRPQSSTF